MAEISRTLRATAGLAIAVLTAACSADTSATMAIAPTAANQACLRDVAATTNNPEVTILESSFSQAGTEVIVGVGPDQARWSCIGYDDGTTAAIMSLTDEGYL